MMKHIFLLLIFLATNKLYGQTVKSCPRYDSFMQAGRRYLKPSKKNFEKAINQFMRAQIAARECNISTADANNEIGKVFEQIELQRDEAVKMRDSLRRIYRRLLQRTSELEKMKNQLFLIDDTLMQLRVKTNYIQDSLQKHRLFELQVLQRSMDSVLGSKDDFQFIKTYVNTLINSESKRKINLEQQIEKEENLSVVRGSIRFSDLKAEYQKMFEGCVPNKERSAKLDEIVNTITLSKSRYQEVSLATGVPWYFIAVLHAVENSSDFSKHLHNSDPLTSRTVHVPVGFPKDGKPPFTWEASAEDALRLKRLDQWTDWSVPAMLFKIEEYNGFGYRRRGIHSPYLWSGSNFYTKGKFLADGLYDPNAISKQIGAAVLLKEMQNRKIIVI